MTSRLVVLVSGSGTNMGAVAEACASGQLDAEIASVITNRSDAGAIERAETYGLHVDVVPVDGRSRAIYDGVLAHTVDAHEPDLVVLAGFMRILSSSFLRRFRVINLHPALPGAFPGLNAIERSFDACQAGTVEHGGVMVHWVPDEGVDDGPMIASVSVPCHLGETLEAFETRVHTAEHELLVAAIATALDQIKSEASALPPTAPSSDAPSSNALSSDAMQPQN